MLWLVLIYTLPSHPTRKRAFVWRELKRVGAVYLRDGVCVLPDQPTARKAMHAIAGRVRGYDGQATLIEGARLDDLTVTDIIRQAHAARDAEYLDLTASCSALLAHAQREARHRDLANDELSELEQDLAKLGRWLGDIHARDHFLQLHRETSARAETALAECSTALQRLRRPAAALR